MQNIEFHFCKFSENIISKVLLEQPANKTVFIFPNESSKNKAQKEFQHKWLFSQTLFLTMEELKELCFLSDKPLLKEEKRTLALYGSITEEDKTFFRIHDYFQSIEIAQNLFDLWEEFNEELVNEEKINPEKFAALGVEFSEWQEKTFNRLKSIKTNYKKYLEAKNFNDIIFLYKPQCLNFFHFNNFQRFVIVNQFYYTNLEKKIINTFADSGKEISIYFQLPESQVDKVNLKVRFFSLQEFEECHSKKFTIAESKNDFSMITSLLEQINNNQIRQIVDVSFGKKTYSKLLSFSKFHLSTTQSFAQTSIYQFFSTLFNLADNLIFNKNEKDYLLPIQSILDAALNNDFFNYFYSECKNQDRTILREQLLNFLYSLIENDYKYIDLRGTFFNLIQKNQAIDFIQSIIKLLKKLFLVKNIFEFNWFVNEIIKIDAILTQKELLYSNIKEIFYQSFSDFYSIEEMNLFESWDKYFDVKNSLEKNVIVSAGILKLFLNYIKSLSINYSYEQLDSKRIKVTNLEDTRNIQYKNVAVLNLVEGVLPSAHQIPFLFTEKQRKILNLKTYDDVKLREKYYFFRLILSAKNVTLYTQKNINQNIEVSSFVEEIKLSIHQNQITHLEAEDKYYRDIYSQFLNSSNYQVSKDAAQKPDFFAIPLEKSKDFPSSSLDLTPYVLQEFKDNAFSFFLHHICGIDERAKEVDMDFSAKLIGIIVHDIINEMWRHINQEQNAAMFGYDFSSVNQTMIDSIISNVLNKQNYFFKISHNYTSVYFEEIVLPVIQQGVKAFFHFLETEGFSHEKIVVIPEKEFGSLEEKKYKLLFPAEENSLNINLRIRGRADLRIELPDKNKNFIFDYKTGGLNENQLIAYELFYYLLEKPELIDQIFSYFYHVLNQEEKELREYYKSGRKKVATKSEIFDLFKEGIMDAVNFIADYGYSLPAQRSKLGKMPEITRKDLFVTMINMAK